MPAARACSSVMSVVAAGVTVADLVTSAVGIVLATEHHPDHADSADRLFRLAVAGLGQGPGTTSAGPGGPRPAHGARRP
jgi:hypothetical protein